MSFENTTKTYSMQVNLILLLPKKYQFKIQQMETLCLTRLSPSPATFLIMQQVKSYTFSTTIFMGGSEAHESTC